MDCESLSVGKVSAFAGICIYKDSQDLITQFLGYGREAIIGREEIFLPILTFINHMNILSIQIFKYIQ